MTKAVPGLFRVRKMFSFVRQALLRPVLA